MSAQTRLFSLYQTFTDSTDPFFGMGRGDFFRPFFQTHYRLTTDSVQTNFSLSKNILSARSLKGWASLYESLFESVRVCASLYASLCESVRVCVSLFESRLENNLKK